jgi:biopolymer transport protein TolR
MAGGLAKSGRTRGRRSARRSRLSEINVTPFVDVMLVLLIVFMVTAPLLTVSIPVQLPQTDAKQSAADSAPLAITIAADGKIYLQETVVTREDLVARLRALSREGYDRQIFIRGDKTVPWDAMAGVMAQIGSAGFRKLQLVTDTDENGPPPAQRGRGE